MVRSVGESNKTRTGPSSSKSAFVSLSLRTSLLTLLHVQQLLRGAAPSYVRPRVANAHRRRLLRPFAASITTRRVQLELARLPSVSALHAATSPSSPGSNPTGFANPSARNFGRARLAGRGTRAGPLARRALCSVAAATRACFHWERVHAERRWGARGTIRGREREDGEVGELVAVRDQARWDHRCRERGPEQRGERK